MRLLVCGDRTWSDLDRIVNTIIDLRKEVESRGNGIDVIITDSRDGASSMAKFAAYELKISTQDFLADWHIRGPAAVRFRNYELIVKGEPDLILVFHDRPSEDPDIFGLMKRATKSNIEIRIIKNK